MNLNERLRRVEEQEPLLEALLPEPSRLDRLSAEREALHQRYPEKSDRPALFGVPIGVKDLFHVEGFVTRAGSALPPELFSGSEGPAVTRLKQAGGLILGKTVATEFAFSEPGPTRNPHHPDHTPGGSSSGSAAAVAAGYVPVALGTQTIGSISRPASYCGVIGVKPSYGRIPTAGSVPFSESVDHVGFFAESWEWVQRVAPILYDEWSEPDAGPDNHPFRIGFITGSYAEEADQDMQQALVTMIDQLAARGHELMPIPLFDDWSALVEMHYDLIAYEKAEFHREWFTAYQQLYRPGTRELIERGQSIPAERANTIRAYQLELRQQIDQRMIRDGIDLWLTPGATGPAPQGLQFTGNPRCNLPWSFTGLPTVTFPVTKTSSGLPLGIQAVGCFGQDERLLTNLLKRVVPERPA